MGCQLFRVWILLFLGVSALAGAQNSSAPPAYMAGLKALEGDEEAFVKAFRLEERSLFEQITTEKAALTELQRSGNRDEAISKQGEIGALIDAVTELYGYGMALYPENPRMLTYHGEFLYDVQGKEEEAIRLWMRSLTFDDSIAITYNNLSLHYAHTGQYKIALEYLDKAMKLDKNNPDFYFNLAQFYLLFRPQTEELRGWKTKKVYKEGMKASRKASELSPGDFELARDYAVNFFAGENFGVEVDWKDGAKAWQQARKNARNQTDLFYTWLNEARSWINAKKDKEAMACLNAALEIFPGNDVAQQLLGGLELKEEKS